MNKTPTLMLALLSAIMIPATRQLYAAAQTIDGVISDTMCGRNHMLPGKTDAQCIQECMKGKVSYALVTGTKVYTLAGKPQTIAPLAGKHVLVVGDVKDNTITVTSIHEMKAKMQPGMPM